MATLKQRAEYLIQRAKEQRENMPSYARMMAGVTESLDLLDDVLALVADMAKTMEGDG